MLQSRSPALRIRQSACRSFESSSVRAAPGLRSTRAAANGGLPPGDDQTSAMSTAGERLRVDPAAQASGLVNPRVAGDRGEHRPRLCGPLLLQRPALLGSAGAWEYRGCGRTRPAGRRCRDCAQRRMAAERTWLAWWRTALVATAGALGVGRLAPRLLHAASAPYIVLGCCYACSHSPCSSSDPVVIARLPGRSSAARPRRSPRPQLPFSPSAVWFLQR